MMTLTTNTTTSESIRLWFDRDAAETHIRSECRETVQRRSQEILDAIQHYGIDVLTSSNAASESSDGIGDKIASEIGTPLGEQDVAEIKQVIEAGITTR